MFLTPLALASDPTPGMWVVSAPLIWHDDDFGRITVPRGFRTDLASYPRILRNLPCFDIAGASRRPATMHDWLYASQRGALDKGVSDDFLFHSLRAEGVGRFCAWATYQGVNLFGGHAWRGDAGALESRDFDTPENYAAWRDHSR